MNINNLEINMDDLMNNITAIINDSNKEITNENANADGASPMGQMSLIAGEVSKAYALNLINEEAKKAFMNGFIHIHDFDLYATGTTTCCQIPLDRILASKEVQKEAFKVGYCGITHPDTISVAVLLAANILQTNQNQQHGGQAYPNWDYYLAPYVKSTYDKYCLKFSKMLEVDKIEDEHEKEKLLKRANKLAKDETREITMKAMKGFVHNCNSMLCRNGMQVPFVSINFGLDTSWEGRLVSECTLLAQEKGIGNGDTPIFPILIFKHKKGVNDIEGTPNFDLYNLAIRVLSTRLFPNFMFMDSSFNSKFFDIDDYHTHPATMGAVEGQEVITYKYKGIIYTEGFSRMWERVSIDFNIGRQGDSDYIKMPNRDILTILDKNDDGKNYFTPVKTVIKNDDQHNWWKLKLDNGRSLKLTQDHPLVTSKGRLMLENIEIGDSVYIDFDDVQYNNEVFNFDKKNWLLGLILCDGCYSGGCVRISLGLDEKDILDKAKLLLSEIYNIDSKIIEHNRGLGGKYYDLVSVGSTVKFVKEFNNLFGGMNKINRQIPINLITSEHEALSMLGGMIDADGHIRLVKGSPRLEIGSTNKELALQQMALLQKCGYKTKMYLNKYSNAHNRYRYKVETYLDNRITDYIISNKKSSVIKNAKNFTVVKTPVTAKVIEKIELGFIGEFGYDVETESDKFLVSGIHSHNCRTANPVDGISTEGRGNLSFTTLNLPMLAQCAKNDALSEEENVELFLEYVLPKYMKIAATQLKERMEYQMSRNVDNFKFLYKDGPTWTHESNFTNGKVGDAIKNGTLAIGFIGLAEALIILTGHHHGEDSDSRKLGLKIVKQMRAFTEKLKSETLLNYSVIATPAEGYAGKSLKVFKNKYGEIPGVSDKEFFTNSFHIPVYYDITVKKKIDYEAPYHKLCNGGHISYIELDGAAMSNPEAIQSIIEYMSTKDMGYVSINIPVDKCSECGFNNAVIENECPKCGSKKITRIRRITGYLVGSMERWNPGKKAEESMRVKHK